MNAAPAVARLVRPQLCPPEAVIRCACEGLRAFGLEAYADAIEWAQRQHHDGGVSLRDELAEAIQAMGACVRALYAMGAPRQWQELANETCRLLRAAHALTVL